MQDRFHVVPGLGLCPGEVYATWLVSDGVPINDAQRLLGHARASTTLDLYTHHQRELDHRVGDLFADFSLTSDPPADPEDEDDETEDAG
jgi:hypothetical protein